MREPHQRSQFGEAQRTHPRTYRFNQFHLFDGLFMFGARADNRTVFCTAKTWFAVAAATARSRCGLRSREYTKFSVKRPQRSENSGTHRTHPRSRCLFLHGASADNRTAFCAAKTWFAEAAIFATQKSTAESRMSDFFGNRISGRKNAKCRVPTLAADVSFCTGRERIIGPLFHCERKFIFPRQHPDESKTYVKNRVLLLKNI